MISSGTSAFVRCTCSATGRILSSAKRRNVSATSSKSSDRWLGSGAVLRALLGEPVQELGRAVGLDERQRGREVRGGDAPRRLASERSGW